jgi:hypothetical protein
VSPFLFRLLRLSQPSESKSAGRILGARKHPNIKFLTQFSQNLMRFACLCGKQPQVYGTRERIHRKKNAAPPPQPFRIKLSKLVEIFIAHTHGRIFRCLTGCIIHADLKCTCWFYYEN